MARGFSMGWTVVEDWLNQASLHFLGGVLVVLMLLAVGVGVALHHWNYRAGRVRAEREGDLEGLVVSAVLGLLALLMGFTFSLAVDRFDTRRALVLVEANAIGTAYLRAQLLQAPHRARLSGLLLAYTDNRIALAKSAKPRTGERLAENDRLVTELWAATAAAVPSIRDPGLTGALLQSLNAVIDLDAARKTARMVRVPAEVFAVLFVYLIGTAGVLGYVFVGNRGRGAAAFMLLLLTLSFLLILDIDRPTMGGVREDQGPMEQLLVSLKAQPPPVFDRYRAAGNAAPD
ncbi:MAG: hypothetical protein V4466_11920 [Pseudomonadota bacterium]